MIGVPSRRRDKAFDRAVDLARRFVERRVDGKSWVKSVATPRRIARGKAVGEYSAGCEKLEEVAFEAHLLGSVLSGRLEVDPDDFATIIALKRAAATLLHERFHSVGSKDEQAFEQASRAYVERPWGRLFDEGMAEIATERNLKSFCKYIGLDAKVPAIRQVGYAPTYASFRGAMWELVTQVSAVTGLNRDDLEHTWVKDKANAVHDIAEQLLEHQGVAGPTEEQRDHAVALLTAPLVKIQLAYYANREAGTAQQRYDAGAAATQEGMRQVAAFAFTLREQQRGLAS